MSKRRKSSRLSAVPVPEAVEKSLEEVVPAVSNTRKFRRLLTLASVSSFVALTAIVSTTKDGFDFVRDYMMGGLTHNEQAGFGSSPEVLAVASGNKSVSLNQSIQELTDLLQYRSPYIARKFKDESARREYLALHAQNISALKQGKLVLSHEISNRIQQLIYSNLEAEDLSSLGFIAETEAEGGGGKYLREPIRNIGGGSHSVSRNGGLGKMLAVWHLYPSPPPVRTESKEKEDSHNQAPQADD